jgi:hypothetical protein
MSRTFVSLPKRRGLETVGHLERHRKNLIHPHPLPEDAMFQRLALEQLRRNEGLRLVLVDLVAGADVRGIQRQGRLGLPLEPLQAVSHFRAGVRFVSDDPEANCSPKCALVFQRGRGAAANSFRQALRLRLDYAEAREQLLQLKLTIP